jgi:hypothetical protein
MVVKVCVRLHYCFPDPNIFFHGHQTNCLEYGSFTESVCAYMEDMHNNVYKILCVTVIRAPVCAQTQITHHNVGQSKCVTIYLHSETLKFSLFCPQTNLLQ